MQTNCKNDEIISHLKRFQICVYYAKCDYSVVLFAPAGPTCSPVRCRLGCRYGFVKDSNGCEICWCNSAPGKYHM